MSPTTRATPALALAVSGTLAAHLGATTVTSAAAIAAGLTTPDAVVLTAVAGLGALVATWYALSALALLVATVTRGITRATVLHRCSRWGAPGLRRLAATALTAGLTFGGVGAAQAAGPPGTDLGWGTSTSVETDHPTAAPAPQPAPTTATTPTAPPAPAPPVISPPTPASESATTHVVRPGESLWTIARSHLTPGATDAEVDAAWRRWYAANHLVIGPDADLIRPGQNLTTPHTPQENP